jgi:predicted O-methyltransferase YrrM
VLDLLPDVDGPIDFVLNDADKENAVAYFDLVAGKLAPGGVFLTDNITTHPQLGATLLPHIRRDARFFTTTVPVGNGMELTVRRRSA